MPKQLYLYILTNRREGVLYTGVTNDLCRRLAEHRSKAMRGFTARYNVSRLVYYEVVTDPQAAISREKQIKRWRGSKKLRLIEAVNPEWRDLSEEW